MSFKMTQNQYTSLYGPTVGDSIRLGDTNLFAQIEKDYAVYGEEATFGGGKSKHYTTHFIQIKKP
uniref:Urease alpha-subunit N-terminal domain-containing protein n=1 Tax=Staphylococcus aureus TaxID=1280 RepID=A0A2C9TVG7_STAAU|nr:hypothetical protein EP54_07555 [Staphylococcus aureus]